MKLIIINIIISIINKVFDLKNYFCLLYYSEFNKIINNQKNNIFDKYKLFFLEIDNNFHFLNSNLFEKLFFQELISIQAVFMMLLHILWKIQLYCMMKMQMNLDNNKKSIVIEKQISDFIIKIIDMIMIFMQLTRYAAVHQKLIRNFQSNIIQFQAVKKK